MVRLHPDELDLDPSTIRALLRRRCPARADLPLVRLEGQGTQHHVFRLGGELLVRIPRTRDAERQVAADARWLPWIASHLSEAALGGPAVPEPLLVAPADDLHPTAWIVTRWIAGQDLATSGPASASAQLGQQLGRAIRAVWALPNAVDIDAPPAGKRGGPLAPHHDEVRRNIGLLPDELREEVARAWDAASAARAWTGPPRWVHGDLLPSNVVVRDGELAGLIDWGSAGLGDPACDLMLAWALPETARQAFRDELDIDPDTWRRAEAWVIEQAVGYIPYYADALPDAVAAAWRRLESVSTR